MKRLEVLLVLFTVLLLVVLPFTAHAAPEPAEEPPLPPVEDYINETTGVWQSLLFVAAAIALDTLLGVLLGIKTKTFDLALLPQFLMTGVLPYLGGLLILAVLGNFIGVPFLGFFFTSAVFIAGKYVRDLVEKIRLIFESPQ